MCGRYALAGYDPDELLSQFARQLQPDNSESEREAEEPPSREQDEQPTTSEEQATSYEDAGDTLSGELNAQDGGERLEGGEVAEVGPSCAAGGAGEKARVRWASEGARMGYRRRYNVAPRTKCVVARLDPATKDGSQPSVLLDVMEWGIIPSWSKSPPNVRPINARDDSVQSGQGQWASMRGKKRCVVIAEGFYEWLTKSSKEKIPHFTKPKNGGLMIMAGLWDSVSYPGSDHSIETFAVVTTSANKQLRFLHERMPVMLSTPREIARWLSPAPWSPSIDNLMKPFKGPLTCYKVPQEVGNVRNDSPDLAQPIAERKGNIASMFAKQASSPPRRPISPPDLSKPALSLTSPTRRRREPGSAPVALKKADSPPSPGIQTKTREIDSFFKKQAPTPSPKQGKKRAQSKVKMEDQDADSSDLEVLEESAAKPATRASPRKKVKRELTEDGEEDVKIVEQRSDGKFKVEDRGVQKEMNPA